jgi:hypothetical protein
MPSVRYSWINELSGRKMLSNAGERRFQGMMSEDYPIVMRGIPHLAEIDQKV